jgi:hypothetical protein
MTIAAEPARDGPGGELFPGASAPFIIGFAPSSSSTAGWTGSLWKQNEAQRLGNAGLTSWLEAGVPATPSIETRATSPDPVHRKPAAGAKPTAPAAPRATFAAHPSLRVRWAEYAPAEIGGDNFLSSCGEGLGASYSPGKVRRDARLGPQGPPSFAGRRWRCGGSTEGADARPKRPELSAAMAVPGLDPGITRQLPPAADI